MLANHKVLSITTPKHAINDIFPLFFLSYKIMAIFKGRLWKKYMINRKRHNKYPIALNNAVE
jgi:hypothetical protein